MKFTGFVVGATAVGSAFAVSTSSSFSQASLSTEGCSLVTTAISSTCTIQASYSEVDLTSDALLFSSAISTIVTNKFSDTALVTSQLSLAAEYVSSYSVSLAEVVSSKLLLNFFQATYSVVGFYNIITQIDAFSVQLSAARYYFKGDAGQVWKAQFKNIYQTALSTLPIFQVFLNLQKSCAATTYQEAINSYIDYVNQDVPVAESLFTMTEGYTSFTYATFSVVGYTTVATVCTNSETATMASSKTSSARSTTATATSLTSSKSTVSSFSETTSTISTSTTSYGSEISSRSIDSSNSSSIAPESSHSTPNFNSLSSDNRGRVASSSGSILSSSSGLIVSLISSANSSALDTTSSYSHTSEIPIPFADSIAGYNVTSSGATIATSTQLTYTINSTGVSSAASGSSASIVHSSNFNGQEDTIRTYASGNNVITSTELTYLTSLADTTHVDTVNPSNSTSYTNVTMTSVLAAASEDTSEVGSTLTSSKDGEYGSPVASATSSTSRSSTHRSILAGGSDTTKANLQLSGLSDATAAASFAGVVSANTYAGIMTPSLRVATSSASSNTDTFSASSTGYRGSSQSSVNYRTSGVARANKANRIELASPSRVVLAIAAFML